MLRRKTNVFDMITTFRGLPSTADCIDSSPSAALNSTAPTGVVVTIVTSFPFTLISWIMLYLSGESNLIAFSFTSSYKSETCDTQRHIVA
jgi:hypothetical protein